MFLGYLKKKIHSQGVRMRPISWGISLQRKSTGSINFSPEGILSHWVDPSSAAEHWSKTPSLSQYKLQLKAVVTAERKCSYLEPSQKGSNHPQHLRTHVNAKTKSMQERTNTHGHMYMFVLVSVWWYMVLGTHRSDSYMNNNLLHPNVSCDSTGFDATVWIPIPL